MAENHYEIPIYIKPVETGAGESFISAEGKAETFMPVPSPLEETEANQIKAVAGAKSQANPAKSLATQIAKKVAMTALDNYGNITGDYTTQQNIQTAVSEAVALGTAVAGGPVGMALYAVDKVVQVFDYAARLKRSEAEANFKQQRVYARENKA